MSDQDDHVRRIPDEQPPKIAEKTVESDEETSDVEGHMWRTLPPPVSPNDKKGGEAG